MRKTGLRVLGDVPWGRHVALFYETTEDLLESCVPFLKAGLESNEMCLWLIAEPLTEKDARAALRRAVPALDRYRADGRVEILQSRTWYFSGDSPDLEKVARGWQAKLDDALGRGLDGLRVAASAPHLEAKDWADFFRYEEQLNGYLSDRAMLLLCIYPLRGVSAADVGRAHPSSVVKRHGKWEAR
jgi:hypothetical protein